MKNFKYLRAPYAVLVAGLAAVATTAAVAIFVLDHSLQARAIAFDWALMALAFVWATWALSHRSAARSEILVAIAQKEKPPVIHREE